MINIKSKDMTSTFNIIEFLLEDVSPKTIKKLLLAKYSPEILENTAKKYGFLTIEDLITDVKNRIAFKINDNEQYDPKTQELYKLMMFLVEWKEKYNLDILNYYGIYQAMKESDDIIKSKKVNEINNVLETAYISANTTDFALLNGLYKGNAVRLVYENEHCWIYQVVDGKVLCITGLARDTSWCVRDPYYFEKYSTKSYFYIVYPKEKKIYEKSSGAYRKFALRLPKEEYAKKVFAANIIDEEKIEELIKLRGSKNVDENFETVFNNVTKKINYFVDSAIEKAINKLRIKKNDNNYKVFSYENIVFDTVEFYFDTNPTNISINNYETDKYEKIFENRNIVIELLHIFMNNEDLFSNIDVSDNVNSAVKKLTTYVLLGSLKFNIIKLLLEYIGDQLTDYGNKPKATITDNDIIKYANIFDKDFIKIFNNSKNASEIIIKTLFGDNVNPENLVETIITIDLYSINKEKIENIIKQFEGPFPLKNTSTFPPSYILSQFKNLILSINEELKLTFSEKNSEFFVYSLFYSNFNHLPLREDHIANFYDNYLNLKESNVNDGIGGIFTPFEWTNERQYLKYLDFEKLANDKEHYPMVKDFIERMYPEYFTDIKINKDYQYKLKIIKQFKNELTNQKFIEFFNKMFIKFLENVSKYIVQHEIKPTLENALKQYETIFKMISKLQKFCGAIIYNIDYFSKEDFYKNIILFFQNPTKILLKDITIKLFLGGITLLPEIKEVVTDVKEFEDKLAPSEKITFFSLVPASEEEILATRLINYYRQLIYDKYKE